MKARKSIIALPEGICRFCRTPFSGRRHDQEFCKPACRLGWHRREIARSKQAYAMLMEWARARGKTITMADVKKTVHGWIEEDRG